MTFLLLVVAIVLVALSDLLVPRDGQDPDDVNAAEAGQDRSGLVDGGEIVLAASAELLRQSGCVVVADFDGPSSADEIRDDIGVGLSSSGLEHSSRRSGVTDVAVLRWHGRSCGTVVIRPVADGWRAVYSRSPDCPWPVTDS